MKEIQWWNSLTHTHTHRQTVVYSLASYHICMTIRIDSLYIPFLSVMVLFCCLSILLDVKSWPASVHVPTHKETTQCLPPFGAPVLLLSPVVFQFLILAFLILGLVFIFCFFSFFLFFAKFSIEILAPRSSPSPPCYET
jgi:hypothetical protein